MNIAAAILASLHLFMSVQPPVLSNNDFTPEEEGCQAGKSCSISKNSCRSQNKKSPENDEPGGCCKNTLCNPFGPCCNCLFIERSVHYIISYPIQSKKVAPANEDILSSYINEFWHPPELICYTQQIT